MFKEEFSAGEPNRPGAPVSVILNRNMFDGVKLRFGDQMSLAPFKGRVLVYEENGTAFIVIEDCTVMASDMPFWSRVAAAWRFITKRYPEAFQVPDM